MLYLKFLHTYLSTALFFPLKKITELCIFVRPKLGGRGEPLQFTGRQVLENYSKFMSALDTEIREKTDSLRKIPRFLPG